MEHACGLSYLSEVVVNAEVRSPDWSPSAAKAVLSAFESTDESHGGQLAASVVINVPDPKITSPTTRNAVMFVRGNHRKSD